MGFSGRDMKIAAASGLGLRLVLCIHTYTIYIQARPDCLLAINVLARSLNILDPLGYTLPDSPGAHRKDRTGSCGVSK